MTRRSPLVRFLARWLVCSLGLWIAAAFLSGIDYGHELHVIITGGLVLAIINAILKPLLIIFSLPAILFTLGLFIVVINGLTVYIASLLYRPLHVRNFWVAIVAGIIIGIVNYLVTAIMDDIEPER